MPVVAFSFPPQRGLLLDESGLRYVSPEYANVRSQDLPKVYHDCGQFYFYRTEAFLRGIPMGESRVRAMVLYRIMSYKRDRVDEQA